MDPENAHATALRDVFERSGKGLELGIKKFLFAELNAADTFLKLAKSDGPERRERNRANAKHAYETISQFMGRVQLTPDEEADLQLRLAAIKDDLEALGEHFK